MTAGYNVEGLRAWKQTAVGRTYYLYADGVIPICELDTNGNVVATNTFGEGGLLARHTIASFFYAFDPQGSASHRLDSNGNTLSTSIFDASGARVTNDTGGDPFAYFGGQFGYCTDVETGMQILGQRYYDTSVGRFLNRDPIGYEGGINIYNYTRNQFGNHSDPTGLDDIIEIPSSTFGYPFDHRYIHLQRPCNGFTDVGYWPSGNNIPGQHNIVITPDPDAGHGYPVVSNPANNFDVALCACILATVPGLGSGPGLTPILPLPGHGNDSNYPGHIYACGEWSRDMWNCARRRLGMAPIPSPKPGNPRGGQGGSSGSSSGSSHGSRSRRSSK